MATKKIVAETIEEVIEEKANELIKICRLNKVPIAMTYIIPESTGYLTHAVTPLDVGVKLPVDRITPVLTLATSDRFKITVLTDDANIYDADELADEDDSGDSSHD